MAQSCLTLCNPHGLYNSRNSPGLACSKCSRNNWKQGWKNGSGWEQQDGSIGSVLLWVILKITDLFIWLHQVLVVARGIFLGVSRLSSCGLVGLVVPQYVGSQFPNQGLNCCIGRQILNQQTTRAVPGHNLITLCQLDVPVTCITQQFYQ